MLAGAYLALAATSVLTLILAGVILDDWRWRRALDAHRDNHALADRAVAHSEYSHHVERNSL